jgi:DNA-directed RNA polymerase specialized sigma24 family protein
MIQDKMILIANKHKNWVDIVMTFGCNKRTAEDLTQEMYIKIQLKLEKGLDIMYEDDINYYYIFKTLRSLFLDLKRKGKNISMIPLDNIHLTNNDVNYDESYDKVKEALSKMYWYDRKVFEIINQGESIAEFSRKSYIHYYSLYNTYKKVKDKLKKLL